MNSGNKIKKGDLVKVVAGKDNGKEGKVLRVMSKENKVLVEDVNVAKRHIRKMEGLEGGILNISKPINLSNVMLICPNCKKPSRVGFEGHDKTKVRVCKKCKEVIKG